MAQILKIDGAAIDSALHGVTRQYLVGNLEKPQVLQHISSSLLEVGITRYGAEGGRALPHTHRQAFEFQYMLSGLSAYLDMITAEEYIFRKGDFYVIEQGVVYAQKSRPHTEILFIKVPPGNDKVPVETTAELEMWFEKPIQE
ncbi:MAG: cupin domain-containing protein [Bryobacteraceae bacterium]